MATVLTIGALANATGVPAETLRTWERRYGFPAPIDRGDAGHRRYPIETVEHVRLAVLAMEHGHKPSVVLRTTLADLQRLLELHGMPRAGSPDAPAEERLPARHVTRLFVSTLAFDTDGLQRALRQAWNELGSEAFIEACAAPYLVEIGERWERGEIEVANEHFASEQFRTFLSSQWAVLSERAGGPRVVCATPPGELHVLGLHLAATALVAGDAEVIFLGASTPASDVATVVRGRSAAGVVLSASPCSSSRDLGSYLRELKALLPRGSAVLVGGTGFEPVRDSGVLRPGRFRELTDWAREHPRRRPAP
jgi:MerR family transcriptional regulator, light-induced transcriptional regulator